MSVALALVAVVALGTFGLVLILARRFRALTERVNMFLPASAGTLPRPGTQVPEFDVVSADGEQVSQAAFAGVERVFAVLTTTCGSCLEQVSAFRDLGAGLVARPVVVVAGDPGDRAPIVAQLDGHAVVIEEPDRGPVVEAFGIYEFPAVLLVRDGVIQLAGHGLREVLGSAEASAPADVLRQN